MLATAGQLDALEDVDGVPPVIVDRAGDVYARSAVRRDVWYPAGSGSPQTSQRLEEHGPFTLLVRQPPPTLADLKAAGLRPANVILERIA